MERKIKTYQIVIYNNLTALPNKNSHIDKMLKDISLDIDFFIFLIKKTDDNKEICTKKKRFTVIRRTVNDYV